MRARAVFAALLAATVALPLAGCFGLPSPTDVADRADDVASQARELADTLSGVEWGKVSRLVVRDAQSGEVKVLEVTTYEASPVVGLEVSPIGLRLHLSSQAAADSLRALAG